MEPLIIDYYNEEPYMIAVIDNMNKELDDLQIKYIELELKYIKLYNKYVKIPIISFTSIQDRNDKHNKMIDNLKNKCNEYIEEKNSTKWGRDSLYDYGLNQSCIYDFLYEEFMKLSNNHNWSHVKANECWRSFIFFRGREMPHWNKIYNSLTINDIKDIMFNHIVDWIYDNIYCDYIYHGEDDY